MTWTKLGQGKSHWIPAPGDDGKGEWAYSCNECQDTGWVLETKPHPVYHEITTSRLCECRTKTAPIQNRPDISSSWPWVKHDNRLMYRVIGDRTYWIYPDGKLTVFEWPEDRFDHYEPDLALANLYAELYSRRSTRRSHPGADDYYAK